MKPKTIASWLEMSQSYLTDGPPKVRHYEAIVFVNRCEVRETPTGKRYLLRNLGIETLIAPTRRTLEDRVSDFAMRDDVRLLARGLETNDFDALPRKSANLTSELLDGSCDLYAAIEVTEDHQ